MAEPAPISSRGYAHPEVLVSTAWVEEHLNDPKIKIFRDTMKNKYYTGYAGPISAASGAVNADYVLVQMCASVATDAATPEAAAAEAERRAKRYFRRG